MTVECLKQIAWQASDGSGCQKLQDQGCLDKAVCVNVTGRGALAGTQAELLGEAYPKPTP